MIKSFLESNTLRTIFYISILTIKYTKVNKNTYKIFVKNICKSFWDIENIYGNKKSYKACNVNGFKEWVIFLEY